MAGERQKQKRETEASVPLPSCRPSGEFLSLSLSRCSLLSHFVVVVVGGAVVEPLFFPCAVAAVVSNHHENEALPLHLFCTVVMLFLTNTT
jgi:hypothetical protein